MTSSLVDQQVEVPATEPEPSMSRAATAALVFAILALVSAVIPYLDYLSIMSEFTGMVFLYDWITGTAGLLVLFFGLKGIRAARAGFLGKGTSIAALLVVPFAIVLVLFATWVDTVQARPVGQDYWPQFSAMPPQPNGMTAEKMERIEFDMSREQVFEIAGSEGKLTYKSKSLINGLDQSYEFPLANGPGSVRLEFRNNKLVSTGSSGL